MPKFSLYEVTVLSSLFRIEKQNHRILNGISELLNDGPNDQGLKEELRKLASDLERETLIAQKAIEEAQAQT